MSIARRLASQSGLIFLTRLFGAGVVFLAQAGIARFWGAGVLADYLVVIAAVNIVAVVMPLGFETIGTYFAAEYRAHAARGLLAGFMRRAYGHIAITAVLLWFLGPFALPLLGHSGSVLAAHWWPVVIMAVATAVVYCNSALLVGLKRPYAGFFADTLFRPLLIVISLVLAGLALGEAARLEWLLWLIALGFALLAAALATFAFPRLSAAASVGLLAGLSLLWLGAAALLVPHDAGFSTTGPLATNLFLLAVAVPYQWQLSQRKSRRLLDTLRQYVAPKVVEELLRSDLADPLAPRQLDVTTLIADMEGYTTQVESLSMEESARLTREFLDCLTGPVIAMQGTLDKYTGDGLVAFWGAPLPIPQHADLALDAACEIVARVRELSRRREAQGHPPLRVRIGIESGPAVAGDFGTSFRSIYTAVGDSVNTASRLEQAARDFPHDVIVGAGTVERARRHRFILLGERVLRGKGKATVLYTPESIGAASGARAAELQE